MSAWLYQEQEFKRQHEVLWNLDKLACLMVLKDVAPMLQQIARVLFQQQQGPSVVQAVSINVGTQQATQGTGGSKRSSSNKGSSSSAHQPQAPGRKHSSTTPATASTPAAAVPAPSTRPPADSSLLLLMAGARAVAAAVKLGCCGCHDPAANGWYHQPKQENKVDDSDEDEGDEQHQEEKQQHQEEEEEEQHQEDEEEPGLLEVPELVAGLEPLLSLAHSLTLQGPGTWWEEAKKHHPLLLVQTVLATIQVGRTVRGLRPLSSAA
jgi:DNA mismatch repair ATPase MutL